MLEKTEKPNVYRDPNTGALINKDINKLKSYKKQKLLLSQSKNAMEDIDKVKKDMEDLSNRLDTFTSDINDIKSMLSYLTNNNKS